METRYPKPAEDILVRVKRFDHDPAVSRGESDARVVNLSRKMLEYLMNLGYQNAHVYNVIVHLLTRKKVRLDFATYHERLELANPADKISVAEATALIDDFIAANRGQGPDFGATQRIVIQAPRRTQSP